ncbi:MAG: DUF4331 domain-containing protein [Chloroflexi bacterium]|nr:DUF4331 domain-containing protein [Chloroflexota bacterium]
MMNKLFASLSLMTLALGVASWVWLLPPNAGASSHREAPLTSKDPTIDNTDVYAFVSPDDRDKITLIANWIPFEEPAGGPNFYHFDDNARYLIKIDRNGDGVEDVTYEWRFREEIRNPNTFLYNTGQITSLDDEDFNYRQLYRIREIVRGGDTRTLGENLVMPPDNIGPRSTPDYEKLAREATRDLGNGIKEFTGQRDDPFYVDVGSIFDLLGLRPFNSAHKIKLDNARGVDSTGGFNIHTTAIQVPRSRLAPDCDGDPSDTNCVIGVWSTAERRATIVRGVGTLEGSGDFVQVSRLGNPLVNEVVIDLEQKDEFNGTLPTGDGAFLDRVRNSEVAGLINALYGIDVPSNPRDDLVTVFLTGIPGLNQQQKSVNSPSEQLRLNTAIRPTADVCKGNRLGVLAGDNAGFPNGRRLEDDVTDIELRVVAGGYVLTPKFNKSPNNALADGVNENDRSCLDRFPYMGTPHQGYEHQHHRLGGDVDDDDDDGDDGRDRRDRGDRKEVEDDDDDDPRKPTEEERQQQERTNTAGLDEYRTEGNVVGVRCDLSGPAMLLPEVAAVELSFSLETVPYAVIATRDGFQQVRLLGDTRTQCGSIKIGDYLEVDGVKQHEFLFDAENVTIRRGGSRVS